MFLLGTWCKIPAITQTITTRSQVVSKYCRVQKKAQTILWIHMHSLKRSNINLVRTLEIHHNIAESRYRHQGTDIRDSSCSSTHLLCTALRFTGGSFLQQLVIHRTGTARTGRHAVRQLNVHLQQPIKYDLISRGKFTRSSARMNMLSHG
jgi:hypothetical protein